MKYVVVLGDGMSDHPIEALGGKTPLAYAHKPHMDYLARHGTLGLVQNVPEGMSPGSDIANLSVLGYPPEKYYTGRSPLEAMHIGVPMSATDVAIRCNLVTLSDEADYTQKTLLDYCAEEISTQEAALLMDSIREHLANDTFQFYTGTSYRHCMIWNEGRTGLGLTPPHDITGKKVTQHLPATEAGKELLALMQQSYALLNSHPVNESRRARGLRPANAIWLWGEGKKPALTPFQDLYAVKGAMISAVDLLKGIAVCAEMTVIPVEGATGNIHTNFAGKGAAALQALKDGYDFVFVHIEAPDECGHQGDLPNKIKAIEQIDRHIVGPLLSELPKNYADFKILLLPDHPTPLAVRSHTREPVPYVLYQHSQATQAGTFGYDEAAAAETGRRLEVGSALMRIFLGK